MVLVMSAPPSKGEGGADMTQTQEFHFERFHWLDARFHETIRRRHATGLYFLKDQIFVRFAWNNRRAVFTSRLQALSRIQT